MTLPRPIPAETVGYMQPHELGWLYTMALQLEDWGVPGDLLEVGSYKGLSASALGQAGKLTCIDTFWGGNYLRQGVKSTREDFDAAMKRLDLHPRVLVGTSEEVLPNLLQWGERFRLILIDGDHSYKVAKHDIQMGWKLLSPGGILAVDDMDFPGVKVALLEEGGFHRVLKYTDQNKLCAKAKPEDAAA